MTVDRRHRWLVVLAFALVYVFWGSTYLAIGIAVERIPPPVVCALRFSVAGILMLGFCAVTGRNVRYSFREVAQFALVGNLLLTGGNLTLAFAEQYVPTGLAALIVASIPLFFLVLDAWIVDTHRLSGRDFFGLGLGIVGLVVLLWPNLTSTGALGRKQTWFALSLLGGSFSWALGSVLSKRWKAGGSASATAWQMTFAGLGNLLFATAAGDWSQVAWTPRGLGAVIYLVICGSWVGYTAYVWLLQNAPATKVSTYAYVNPVIAVFLGWLVLHEAVDRYILAGSAVTLAAVALVTSSKVTVKLKQTEAPIVEAVGD
jgi:drug/metabolite transporter (DMT)-like permease